MTAPGSGQPPGSSSPPGWYPDPGGSGGARWWNGQSWAPQPAPGPAGVRPPQNAGVDGFAITSLVTALVGIPVVSIVFGHLARGRIKRSNGLKTGNGLAIAGLVIGYLWAAILTLLIVLAATGVLEEENADDFSGQQKEIAIVIDDFEAAADDEEFDKICTQILTPEFAQIVSQGAGKPCAQGFRDELEGKRQAEIDAITINVNGDTATAEVDEEGTDETITFERRDGIWRISRID